MQNFRKVLTTKAIIMIIIFIFLLDIPAYPINQSPRTHLRNQLLCARYNNPSRIVTMTFGYDVSHLISRIHENLIKIPHISQVQPDIFTTLEVIRKEVDAIFTSLESTDYYHDGRLRISPSKQHERIASLKNALQCARTLRNAMDFFPPDVPLSGYYNHWVKLAISDIDNLIETLDYGVQLLEAGLTKEHPLVKYLALRYQKPPGVTIKNYLGPDMRMIDEVNAANEIENIIDAFLDFLKKESLHPDIYILLYEEGDNLIIELEYDGNVQTEPVLPFYYLRSILGAQASIEHLTIAGCNAIFKPLHAGIWQGASERLESRIAIKKCYLEIKEFIDRLSSIIDEIDGCIQRNENITADSRSYKWLREYNFSVALAKRLGLLNQQKGIPPYYEGGEIVHALIPIKAVLGIIFELGKLSSDTDIELLRSRLQNASMLFERIVHDKLTYPGIRVTIKFPFITPQEAEVMERLGCAVRRNAHGEKRFNVCRFLRLIDICSNLLSTSDISQVKECAQDCQALSQQWSWWLPETIGKISYLSENNRLLITKEKRVEVIQNIERIIRGYTQIKEHVEILLKDINTSSDKTTSSLLLELSEHINLFLKNLQGQIEVATGTPSQELQPIVRLIQERYGQGKIPCITIDDNRVNPDTQVRINGISLEIDLNNIVNNALYFAEKRQKETGIPAEVRIVIYEEKGDLVIEISDNGEGIPPQALAINPETGRQYIFDINYSLRPGGTGQGLTDASYVFKDADGTIKAESPGKLGIGTTFTITLPIARSPEPLRNSFWSDRDSESSL